MRVITHYGGTAPGDSQHERRILHPHGFAIH